MSARRLLLIRHAMAAGGPTDRERPLTEPGLRQAEAIGAWLVRTGVRPDAALVSPAVRAAQTWQGIAEVLDPAPVPVEEERVYDNTVEALLAVIGEVGDDASTLAVVGHNPSIGELARALDDGQGDPEARRDVEAGFPAGAVAVFELAGDFAAIEPGVGTLRDVAVPGG